MLQTNIYLNPKHKKCLAKIANRIYKVIGGFEACYSYCGEPKPIEEHYALEYSPLAVGQAWGVNQFDCAWMILKGEKPIADNVVAIIDIAGEGMVYDKNGVALTAITTTSNQINMFQVFKGKTIVDLTGMDKKVELHIDASFNGDQQAGAAKPILRRADIAIKNKAYHELFYNYMTLYSAMLALEDNERAKEINEILLDAARNIDEPLKAIAILNKAYVKPTAEELEYYAIGHGHLDLAWLWPIRESYRKARRTLAAQLSNIADYPDYVYGLSQPQQLEWVKRDDPELFERVKTAFLKGSLEAQGGMWTESDCNLICGESFIRQFHYGTQFWHDEIGVNPTTCWLPDVFGFSGALPQIIKGCGMKNFMTIKMTWNRVNKFPYKSFNWVGIDGTSVLSHMAPEGDYTCTASPIVAYRGIARYTERNIAPKALIAYGVGDGGCGPSEGHIEMITHQKNIKGMPRVRFSHASAFFEELKKYESKLPKYDGELYLEKHQGTFTTQGRNKKYNRKLEIELHDIEFLLAQLLFKGKNIDGYSLDKYWKEILLYQFHDILPGSSITRVYTESVERYGIIAKELASIKSELLTKLGAVEGMFNTSPCIKSVSVAKDGKSYIGVAKPYSEYVLKDNVDECLNFDKRKMENSRLKLVFNTKSEIVSCFDKVNHCESVNKPFNQLVVYSDPVIMYNAWDIAPKYEMLPKSKFKPVSIETEILNGDIVRTTNYSYRKSTLVQRVILGSNSDIVNFETSVEWDEKNKMLRADFYPNSFGEKVLCDTQFGYKEYSTGEDNSFDKAKYEINAHKFVDVTNNGYGFALLNDCKFGHRVKKGKVSLNLLRSTNDPDPTADRGHHEFKYAIYPHKGSMLDSGVQAKAYAYNYDGLAKSIKAESIIAVDNENVLIETIKPSYDNKSIIIRLYEKSGNSQTIIVTIPEGWELFESDMLEKKLTAIGNKMTLHKFEIKTLAVKKK